LPNDIRGLSWLRRLLQAVEMRFGELQERAELEVGGAPFGEVGQVFDGDGDAGHAGGLGGDDTVERIFEGEALQRRYGEGLGAIHIDLWMGFAVGKVFG
jgi:hypothetical protein